MKIKKFLIGIGLCLLFPIIGLFILEIVVHVLFPQLLPSAENQRIYYQYDELLGWSHIPFKEGKFKGKDFSVNVHINSHGLRDREYAVERIPGKNRILMLGDSIGWGVGVESRNRIDEIIESKYQNLEIINASISGYGTDQQYLYLKHRGIEFKPDLVVLMFSLTDIANNSYKKQYRLEKPVFRFKNDKLKLQNVPVPTKGFWSQINTYILEKTYFFRKALLFFKLSKSKALEFQNLKQESYENGFNITKALLLEISNFTIENNIDFIIVFIPLAGPENNKTINQLVEFAESSNIDYLLLPEVFRDKEAEIYFKHNKHWNSYAHEIAAKELELVLKKENYLNID